MSKNLRFNNDEFCSDEIEPNQSYSDKKSHKHIQADAKSRGRVHNLRRSIKRSLVTENNIHEINGLL
jgi:hypothetical protein